LRSAEPLADGELMRNIVTTGINGIERCATRLKPEQATHWDALLAAALYMRQHKGGEQFGEDAVDLLGSVLRSKTQPVYAEHMVRWLHDTSLVELHNLMAGLLANCGGELVQTELDAYYAQLEITQHKTPQASALVHQPEAKATGRPNKYNDLYYECGIWADTTAARGAKYAVFPAAWLLSDRDLYIAVDAQADGVWEEVLPTGLQDVCFTHCHPLGLCGPGPQGKLHISVDNGVLKIMHHKPVFELTTYSEGEEQREIKQMTGAERIESMVKLSELRLDTDADGLTDITERILFLDPTKVDTDGDGIKDAQDAAPLANPAQMGKLERGIARALKYFVAQGAYEAAWWSGPPERTSEEFAGVNQPLSARYLLMHDCGPVSFSGGAATYGICLNTEEQIEAYMLALQDYPTMSALDISWSTPPPETFSEPGSKDADGLPLEATSRSGLLVMVNFWIAGYSITMVEINGEYYPSQVHDTWAS
jgi:hypothetical protein